MQLRKQSQCSSVAVGPRPREDPRKANAEWLPFSTIPAASALALACAAHPRLGARSPARCAPSFFLDQVRVLLEAYEVPREHVLHRMHPHVLSRTQQYDLWRCDGAHLPGGCRRGLTL
eukprot:TRINITY_DN5782_c0_g1_i1.p1 TRINITY_DN5782_c0_g1~~TRINITY_DN5782_c0_g1_i1.p1  ORF type:complete len:118 (-),score=19.13 TRINITY_DN5782_c0_g1_i1:289-642(-)